MALYKDDKGIVDLPIGTRFTYRGRHGIVRSVDDAVEPCVCEECMLDSGNGECSEDCLKVFCGYKYFSEILSE